MKKNKKNKGDTYFTQPVKMDWDPIKTREVPDNDLYSHPTGSQIKNETRMSREEQRQKRINKIEKKGNGR